MGVWLVITGFGLDDRIYWRLLLQSLLITLNYNSSQKWLPKTRSILTGLRVSYLLVFLLLWLTSDQRISHFWFMNDLVLGSAFYCNCSGSYLAGRLCSVAVSMDMFVACRYPWTRLLLARIHGHACWFHRNDLVFKSLQLPFPYPWTRLTPSDGLCPRIVSPRKRVCQFVS
jgi:hypothetical protein